MSNWRLHKIYYEVIGTLARETTSNLGIMITALKSKTASLPVKKCITEQLAYLIANKSNQQVRTTINQTMNEQIALASTS